MTTNIASLNCSRNARYRPVGVKVSEILQRRYGTRLTDLIPTDRSLLFLYGDDLSSPRRIKDFRQRLGATGDPAWLVTAE